MISITQKCSLLKLASPPDAEKSLKALNNKSSKILGTCPNSFGMEMESHKNFENFEGPQTDWL